MKRYAVAILMALIGGAGWEAPTVFARAPTAAPAAAPAPAPSARVAYGSAPSQFVEVFLPPGPGPFPLAIFMHGGCYITSDANIAGMRRTYAELAKRGVAVWGVEYRRVDEPGGAYPGMFQDVAAAVDLAAAQAGQFHFDLSRVALVGHSAGGHLALWASERGSIAASSPLYAAHPLRAKVVIAIAGPGDIAPLRSVSDQVCGPGVFDGVVGKASATRPDVFSDTSPAALLPIEAPMVLFAGAADDVVPPQFVQVFAKEAKDAGDDVTVEVLPGADHIDLIRPGNPAWEHIADVIAQKTAR